MSRFPVLHPLSSLISEEKEARTRPSALWISHPISGQCNSEFQNSDEIEIRGMFTKKNTYGSVSAGREK